MSRETEIPAKGNDPQAQHPGRMLPSGGAVTAIALILFLLTGIIHALAGSAVVMEAEMRRFAPPDRSGLPEAEYPAMAAHIADYLAGRKDDFQYTVQGEQGERIPCFHDYELAHMADCRSLIRVDGLICGICLAAALAGGILILKSGRAGLREALRGARGALWGLSMLTAVLVLWAVADFDGLFLTFHRLAFRNDLWLLNPRTDLLIRLMPEDLFIDLGLKGLAAFVPGLALLLIAMFILTRRNQ